MIKNFALQHIVCANSVQVGQHSYSNPRVLACARRVACRFYSRNRMLHNPNVSYPAKPFYTTQSAILNSTNQDATPMEPPPRSVQVSRMRDIVGTQPLEKAWEQLWKEGVTPWDAKGVTPAVSHLLKTNQLRDGRVLVPGCGSGYDVVAMGSPTRTVTGLDISATAVQQAQLLAQKSPQAGFVQFQNADFFSFSPPFKFDVVFDYTFFCALEPSMRPRWAAKMAELLALDGELLTLMFPLDEHDGGPPFSVSVEAYEKVLSPWGFRLVSCDVDVPTSDARRGLEKLSRWERAISKA